MDSRFVRTAAVVFCVAWVAGCGTTHAADKSEAPAPVAQASAADFPATLEGEIARAHALRVKGSFEDAAKALSQLMLVAPDDVRVVGEYGKVLAEEGRTGDAVSFLERAVQLDGKDWTIYSALGVAYDQGDNHAKARLAYEHALALNPGSADVLNNLAVSRMLAGDLDGAQRYLAEASANGAGNPKIANNQAMLASLRPAAMPASAPFHAPAAVAAALPSPATASRAPADTAAHSAIGAPRPLIVMQKVPRDPFAGPVGRHTAQKQTVARAAIHKAAPAKPRLAAVKLREPAGTPQQPVRGPMLRTAADGQ